MKVVIAEPNCRRNIRDDKTESGLRTLPNAVLQQVFHRMRPMNTLTFVILPERDWSIPGFDETLMEQVVKDVFKVDELLVLELELDELSSYRFVAARHLVIGQPQFVMGHDGNNDVKNKPDNPSRAVEEVG